MTAPNRAKKRTGRRCSLRRLGDPGAESAQRSEMDVYAPLSALSAPTSPKLRQHGNRLVSAHLRGRPAVTQTSRSHLAGPEARRGSSLPLTARPLGSVDEIAASGR